MIDFVALTTDILFLTVLEAGKVKIKVLATLVPDKIERHLSDLEVMSSLCVFK